MDNTTATLLVPAYFVQVLVGIAILAYWFLKRKDTVLRTFGVGLAGYALGLSAWSLLVIVKPDDLNPLIMAGAIPFLLANLAFAKVAYKNLDFSKASFLSILVIGSIIATFAVRTFVYKSEPYFSEEGLLYFGLHPLSIAGYITTISLTFLPAVSVVATRLKKSPLKNIMQVGLTTLFINSIILVSGNDDTLLLINGVIMTAALLVMWVKALTTPSQKL
jgi:hypothetical protein